MKEAQVGYAPACMADMPWPKQGGAFRATGKGWKHGKPCLFLDVKMADAVLQEDEEGVICDQRHAGSHAGTQVHRFDTEKNGVRGGEGLES